MSEAQPQSQPFVEWAPFPIRRIHVALQKRKASEQARKKFLLALRQLNGCLRLQEDSAGRMWIVLQEPVINAFAATYQSLGLVSSRFDLANMIEQEGLFRFALGQELQEPLDEDDWPEDLTTERALVEAIARDYGLQKEDFVEQWGLAFVLLTLDLVNNLEELLPVHDQQSTVNFLNGTLEVLKGQQGLFADESVLGRLQRLLSNPDSTSARNAFIQALDDLDQSGLHGAEKRLIQYLPLRNPKRQKAIGFVTKMFGSGPAKPTVSTRLAAARVRRRRLRVSRTARARQKQRRVLLRGQRLASWSASTTQALPDDVKAKLRSQIQQRKAAPVEQKAPAPKVEEKPKTAQERKKARKQKRAKEQRTRKQSQRLATWTASQDMQPGLNAIKAAAAEEVAKAKLASEQAAAPATKPKSATTKRKKVKTTSEQRTRTPKTSDSTRRKARKAKAGSKSPNAKAERSPRGRPANPLAQYRDMAVAGGVIVACLVVIMVIYNSIDFNKDKRASFRRRAEALTIKKGYKKHQELLAQLNDFVDSETETVDIDEGTELVTLVEDKIKSAKKSLNEQLLKVMDGDFDTLEERRKGSEFANTLLAWQGVDPTFKKQITELREFIKTAEKWREFADQIGREAKELAQAPEPDLHHLVATELAPESEQELNDLFQKTLAQPHKMKVKKIIEILTDERFHPVFTAKKYDDLKTLVIRAIGSRKYSGKRLVMLNNLNRELTALKRLQDDYTTRLKTAYDKLQRLDAKAAGDIVSKAEKPNSYWFRRVIEWCTSESATQYIAILKARLRPDQVKPEVVVVDKPEKIDEPEVTSEEEEQIPLTYKEEFVLLLDQYRKAKSSGKASIAQDMEEVMKKSLKLVNDSPAMAFDIVEFYRARKGKFSREAVLKTLFQQHIEAAFRRCLPANTGPSGFIRLAEWCKKLSYREGLQELKPYLNRIRPLNPNDGNYQTQRDERTAQVARLAEVQQFLSRRRVDTIKQIDKLLKYLRKNKFTSKTVAKSFRTMVQRLIAEVGNDKSGASELISKFQQIKARSHKQDKAERLEKSAQRRIEDIIDRAESNLFKGIKTALGSKKKQPAIAYDLLQNILTIKPGSPRAYKGLQYQEIDGKWYRKWDASLMSKGYRYDKDIGWYKGEKQPGKYFANGWKDLAAANKSHSSPSNPWVLKSEHFELKSTAKLSESHLVLRRLEAFYLQLFRQFDLYFAPNGNPLVVFGMAKKPIMKVNYYRDRAQFMAHSNPPANWAAGFYSGGRHASFFYSTPGSWTVLQHEIVHQILGENASSYADNWLAEGTAVYMEDAYFDSKQRLKLGPVERHSRPYRYLGEARSGNVSITFDKILSLDTSGEWGSGNISDNYKGAGSVIYFFMTFDGGKYRTTFLNYLRDAYNRGKSKAYEHYFGLSHENLRWFFDNFYKNGFVSHDGRLVTHEEKEIYDQERVLRDYPEPDLKEIETKLAGKKGPQGAEDGENGSEQLKSLKNRIVSNSSVKLREEAIQELLKAGDEGKNVLREALDEALNRALDKSLKKIKSQKAKFRRVAATAVLERREEAYAFIMDPSKYPDANHGKAAQPEVDKLVNRLKDAFYNPAKMLETESLDYQDLIKDIKQILTWQQQHLGKAPRDKAIRAELHNSVNDLLKISEIDLSSEDASIRAHNQQVLAFNDRVKTSATTEETACIKATNQYRMLFGLKALKVDERLVQAARKHSQEMERLKFFSHDSPTPANRTPQQRCKREGAKFGGENIAKGYSQGVRAFDGWYHSSGHHRNMLTKGFRTIGIGQAGVLWTQNFGLDRL